MTSLQRMSYPVSPIMHPDQVSSHLHSPDNKVKFTSWVLRVQNTFITKITLESISFKYKLERITCFSIAHLNLSVSVHTEPSFKIYAWLFAILHLENIPCFFFPSLMWSRRKLQWEPPALAYHKSTLPPSPMSWYLIPKFSVQIKESVGSSSSTIFPLSLQQFNNTQLENEYWICKQHRACYVLEYFSK